MENPDVQNHSLTPFAALRQHRRGCTAMPILGADVFYVRDEMLEEIAKLCGGVAPDFLRLALGVAIDRLDLPALQAASGVDAVDFRLDRAF